MNYHQRRKRERKWAMQDYAKRAITREAYGQIISGRGYYEGRNEIFLSNGLYWFGRDLPMSEAA